MISVIIPALNEQDTIAQVVHYCRAQAQVTEVIVVDDKSVDETVKKAKEAGAQVITSTKLGKGISMKDGILYAQNEILVFLDGDIDPYPPETIQKLTNPLIQGTHDFVKATFSRNAGRVTELVAKPLLSIFYPELSQFAQPLSGMIAGKKSMFEKVQFFSDYGVDVGLLIDMFLLKARIAEVNIGFIDNKSKPWHALGTMSKEVARAIITRAMVQKKETVTLEELESMNIIKDQMEFAIKEQVKGLKKMAVFDMDDTILRGRYIDTCAQYFNFEQELKKLRTSETDPVILSKQIARLLKGRNFGELLKVADSIPPVGDIEEVVVELKKRGYIVGIISDSYDFVTSHVKNKIGADFSLSNELEFSNSTATGEVKIPSFFFNHQNSICKHNSCKTNALQHITEKYQVLLSNCIAIGDSANDLCMVQKAGIGVAFCSKNELLNYAADKLISRYAFSELLDYAK